MNVSFIAGLIGFGVLPAYVASEHGMNGLMRTAAIEFAQRSRMMLRFRRVQSARCLMKRRGSVLMCELGGRYTELINAASGLRRPRKQAHVPRQTWLAHLPPRG